MDPTELEELEKKQGKNAVVSATLRFYSVATFSGFRLLYGDPDCEPVLLDPDVDDETLGSAILTALSKSRFVTSEEMQSVYNTKMHEIKDKSELRAKLRVKRYAYKNMTQMKKEMKYVGIRFSGDQITFEP